MFALVYKDFQLMKRQILLIIPLLVFLGWSAPITLTGVFLILSFTLFGVTFGYDEQVGFLHYGMSMPLSAKDYLFAKLLPSWLLAVLGGVSVSLFALFQTAFTQEMSLLIGTTVFSLTLTLSALLLPFLIRLGPEKGRVVMMLFMFAFFGIFSFFGGVMKKPETIFSWLSTVSIPMLMPVKVLIAIGITVLSFLLSLHWIGHAINRK